MDWEGVPKDIENYFGFIYCVTRLNALSGEKSKYIGKKQFTNKIKRKPLKGKKRSRRDTKESDWRDYYGSSKELKEMLEKHGKENFKREILTLSTCKWESAFLELIFQLKNNVIISDEFLNGVMNLRIPKIPAHLREKYKNFKIDVQF